MHEIFLEYLVNLKVISLLLGLQMGCTKYMCFLCLWDSRDESNNYTKTVRPPREELAVGKYIEKHTPRIDPRKVCLSPLHIKLGRIKNFVIAIDHHRKGFHCLLKNFDPKKSDVKLKVGVFVGPDMRDLMKDEKFD